MFAGSLALLMVRQIFGGFLFDWKHFHSRLANIHANFLWEPWVKYLKEFDVVKVCRHVRTIRFLFRNDRYEFLRCEGCGQIVRLPL